jgi:hypothetical protein
MIFQVNTNRYCLLGKKSTIMTYINGHHFKGLCGETLANEFKTKYIINIPDDYLTEEQVITIIRNGKWHESLMNNLILLNLDHYIQYFVPKYVASYCNAGQKGHLYIGIEDDAEITGIPYMGTINSEMIYTQIMKILPIYLQCDPQTLMHVTQDVNVIIHELECNPDMICDVNVDQQLKEYMEANERNKRMKTHFIKTRDKWTQNMNYHRSKIGVYANCPIRRNNVADYIEMMDKKNETPGKHTEQVNLLRSYKELNINFDNIPKQKEDAEHTVRWILEYRDYRSDIEYFNKPEKPSILARKTTPLRILRRLAPMRVKFMRNNPELKYYMIEIVINSQRRCTETMRYRHSTMSDDWRYRTRTLGLDDCQPCCDKL